MQSNKYTRAYKARCFFLSLSLPLSLLFGSERSLTFARSSRLNVLARRSMVESRDSTNSAFRESFSHAGLWSLGDRVARRNTTIHYYSHSETPRIKGSGQARAFSRGRDSPPARRLAYLHRKEAASPRLGRHRRLQTAALAAHYTGVIHYVPVITSFPRNTKRKRARWSSCRADAFADDHDRSGVTPWDRYPVSPCPPPPAAS
jgi:hypothetical protein